MSLSLSIHLSIYLSLSIYIYILRGRRRQHRDRLAHPLALRHEVRAHVGGRKHRIQITV